MDVGFFHTSESITKLTDMKKLVLLIIPLLLPLCNLQAQWEQLKDTPFTKHHSNGFGVNGKAFIFEGTYDNDGPNEISNEVWEYSPDTDTWTQLDDFPGPGRAIAIGDDMDGKYYFGFGTDRNDLWEYDPVTNEYTELPSCPCIPRAHPALVAHNNKIYMGN